MIKSEWMKKTKWGWQSNPGSMFNDRCLCRSWVEKRFDIPEKATHIRAHIWFKKPRNEAEILKLKLYTHPNIPVLNVRWWLERNSPDKWNNVIYLQIEWK